LGFLRDNVVVARACADYLYGYESIVLEKIKRLLFSFGESQRHQARNKNQKTKEL
jgi:hypothetical protein